MTHEQLQDAHIAALREVVEQRAEIERLTHELTQANEACAALREGKPLGPVIGAQTILNQAKEIERLQAQLAKANERETRLLSLLQRAQTIITLDADIYTIWREDAGEELVK